MFEIPQKKGITTKGETTALLECSAFLIGHLTH